MRLMDQPIGIAAFGSTQADIPRLVDGTLVQARLLKLSPIAPTPAVSMRRFRDSLRNRG
jgi:hypothetical protein